MARSGAGPSSAWMSTAAAQNDILAAYIGFRSHSTTEMGYRLKWIHPQPSSGVGSRMFLGSEKESFWWTAEIERHGAVAASLDVGFAFTELRAKQATATCPEGAATSPEPPPAMARTLRALRALRTMHGMQAAWGAKFSETSDFVRDRKSYSRRGAGIGIYRCIAPFGREAVKVPRSVW